MAFSCSAFPFLCNLPRPCCTSPVGSLCLVTVTFMSCPDSRLDFLKGRFSKYKGFNLNHSWRECLFLAGTKLIQKRTFPLKASWSCVAEVWIYRCGVFLPVELIWVWYLFVELHLVSFEYWYNNSSACPRIYASVLTFLLFHAAFQHPFPLFFLPGNKHRSPLPRRV